MALKSAEKWARDLLACSGYLGNSKLWPLRRRGTGFCHQVQEILLHHCSSNPSGLRGPDTDIIILLGKLGHPSQAVLDHLDRMLAIEDARSRIFRPVCWRALTNMARDLDKDQRRKYAAWAQRHREEAQYRIHINPPATFLRHLTFLESHSQ